MTSATDMDGMVENLYQNSINEGEDTTHLDKYFFLENSPSSSSSNLKRYKLRPQYYAHRVMSIICEHKERNKSPHHESFSESDSQDDCVECDLEDDFDVSDSLLPDIDVANADVLDKFSRQQSC